MVIGNSTQTTPTTPKRIFNFALLNNSLRKYSALFLFLLFLLRTVSEIVHDYIHKDDVRCSQTRLHFHQTEHHCAIDDFVPFVSDIPPFQQCTILVPKIQIKFVSFYKTPHVSETNKGHFPLRGPPIVA